MASRNKTLKISLWPLFCLVPLLLCSTILAAAPKETPSQYMVQLGTFKTISGVRDGYYSIPDKLRSRAMVCRSGAYYTLRCGASAKPQEIDAIFKQFKEIGLEPIVVKADPRICQPASQFLSTRQLRLSSPLALSAQPRPQSTEHGSQAKPYADLSDPKVRQFLQPGGLRVLPETTTRVVLSNRDVNRITCAEGPIKDIIYSKEKGITVKTERNDAFVKFLITRDPMSGNLIYATAPSEFYVVCGTDSTIYTLIALPRNVPAQAVQLVSTKKKITKNISIFQGIPFERKVVMMVKHAYRDDIPDSFTVKRIGKQLNIFRYVNVTLKRTVRADGEGLTLKEYVLSLKPGYAKSKRQLSEKLFLVPELTQNPVGIALERLTLRKGEPNRLFIVERHPE